MPYVSFSDFEFIIINEWSKSIVSPQHRVKNTHIMSILKEFFNNVISDVACTACH